MSTVCRNCRVRVQRLQGGWSNTPPSSGSRRRAPGILRSQRGVTQSIHDRRTDLSVLERRRPWPCKSDLEAKIAAFLKVSPHKGEKSAGFEPTNLLLHYRCNRLEARAGTSLLFFLPECHDDVAPTHQHLTRHPHPEVLRSSLEGCGLVRMLRGLRTQSASA